MTRKVAISKSRNKYTEDSHEKRLKDSENIVAILTDGPIRRGRKISVKRKKYNATSTEIDGIKFRSKKEAK